MSDCPSAVPDPRSGDPPGESAAGEESAERETRHESPPAAAAAVRAAEGTIRRLQSVVLGIALVWLTIQWWILSTEQPRPLPWEHRGSSDPVFQVDINRADWIEWIQLDGIGETMAHRIVADREQRGPFRRIDDLTRVDGIGPATLARIRDHLTVGSEPSPSEPDRQPPAHRTNALITPESPPLETAPVTGNRKPTSWQKKSQGVRR